MLSQQIQEQINRELKKYPADQKQSAVMAALRFVQDEKGWISNDDMADVAAYLGMPHMAVYEVATFYHMYNLKPMGKYTLTVCTNLSCQLMGANETLDYLKGKLGIGLGEVTADGKIQPARGGVHGRLRGSAAADGEQQAPVRAPDAAKDRPDTRGVGQMNGPVIYTTMQFDQPWTLENYLKVGGYQALRKVLEQKMTPDADHRRGQDLRACAVAAAPVSPPGSSGASCRRTTTATNTSCATRTRASRAPPRTGTSCATTRMR